MLGVGIDWVEQFHLVALGSPEHGVTEQFRVEHTAPAVAALIARLARLEPDPAEVRVVLETSHGMLVEALVDAGYTVLPVNPDLIRGRPDRLLAGPGPVHHAAPVDPARPGRG